MFGESWLFLFGFVTYKDTKTPFNLHNFRYTTAGNGLEVLEALECQLYDVILMDVQMPEMDGLEATRQIRAKGSKVHIIAMTANAMQGDREECLAEGMHDYVSKRIQVKELQAALERCRETAPKSPINFNAR